MRGGGPVPEDRPRALSPLLPVGLALRPLGQEAAWKGAGGRALRGTGLFRPGEPVGDKFRGEQDLAGGGGGLTKKFVCHHAKWRHLNIFPVWWPRPES